MDCPGTELWPPHEKPVNTSQNLLHKTIWSVLTNCMQVTVNINFIQWTTVVTLFMHPTDTCILVAVILSFISWATVVPVLKQMYDILHSHKQTCSSISDPQFCVMDHCDLRFYVTVQSFQTKSSVIF
jgi:hypothetical protein